MFNWLQVSYTSGLLSYSRESTARIILIQIADMHFFDIARIHSKQNPIELTKRSTGVSKHVSLHYE